MKQFANKLRVLNTVTNPPGFSAWRLCYWLIQPAFGLLHERVQPWHIRFPLTEEFFYNPNLRYDIRLSLVGVTFVESMANVIDFTNSITTRANGKENR